MKREIKFRTWAEDHMVFLTNAGLQYFDFEGSYALSFVVDGYSGFWGHEQYESCSKLANTFPIMQYTGIKDKNDVEIYEGDIVNITTTGLTWGKEYTYTGVIEFSNGSFVVKEKTKKKEWIVGLRPDRPVSVIGNIYEHPELLTTQPANNDHTNQ